MPTVENNTPNLTETPPVLCVYKDETQESEVPSDHNSRRLSVIRNNTENSNNLGENPNCSYMDV